MSSFTLTPYSGPTAGGNPVAVTGSGLSRVTSVRFGDQPAEIVSHVGDTQVVVNAPPGTGTAAVVAVTADAELHMASYTYVSAPSITSLSPSGGPETGGNAVVITGTGFTGVTTVSFGSTPVPSFTVNSDTSIVAIAPPGVGAVSVSVASPAGSSNTVCYEYGEVETAETIVLAFDSTDWRYLQAPPAADQPSFYKRGFDDSDWPTGQAAFGSIHGPCPWNNRETVKTIWTPNTDLLVRHWVYIPRSAQQVRISGTVDNDAQVYFNGSLVQSVRSGWCRPNAIDVVVPASDVECCNLLAVRAQDHGSATFLNVQVSYTYTKATSSD
ncbi:IPT/TIG domain-containing protein [Streptomyces zingiberis]|uniref:IPT/TIG domain-containing protein n=1 Tax=Streptomyces zingiberis TaxID=2053010 RepID=A0ABX1BPB6_9ACTN|nr:IPT/TIG domain-containing protein [Streptomyces zingiberis]NJP99570.1 hypothetical protein [Streptomyces zingiberis]